MRLSDIKWCLTVKEYDAICASILTLGLGKSDNVPLDFCENGEVYSGLTKLCEKGAVGRDSYERIDRVTSIGD